MHPDVLIIGDSHTLALHEGCKALGIASEILFISGNFWHSQRAQFHPRLGLCAPTRRFQHNRMVETCQKIGKPSLFTQGLPVLASFGYHLGRLVPVMGLRNHTADAADFDQRDDSLFISQAMLQGYVQANRGVLIDALIRAARLCPLTVVMPPPLQNDALTRAVGGCVTALLRAGGVRVHDPAAGQDWPDGVLPDALRDTDGIHGNAAYGTQLMQAIRQG